MNIKKIAIMLLGIVLLFSGCIPSQYTKGVDADEYPERDLPVYDDAVIFEYEGDDNEVTIKYGTEDEVDDIVEFYQEYFEDENIILDEEEEDKDEYNAQGFYEDFLFEIEVEEAKGDTEEKVFSTVVEVAIEFLSDEQIEERQNVSIENEIPDDWTDDTPNDIIVPEVEEKQILNQDGIIVTMKDFEKNYYSLDLNLMIENTADKEINVGLLSIIVNGYSLQDVYLTGIVEANAKLNTEISFGLDELTRCNIGEIVDIELVFELYDYEKWETISISDVISINTSSSFEQRYDSSGITLVDEKGIKIIFQEFIEDDTYYGPYAVFYVENNTNKAVDFDCTNVQVNGFMISGFLYGTVQPDTYAVITLEFFTSDLEDNQIETIDNIKLAFEASYVDEWDYFLESDLMDLPIN